MHRYYKNLGTPIISTAYPIIGYNIDPKYKTVFGLPKFIFADNIVIATNEHTPPFIMTQYDYVDKYPIKDFVTDEMIINGYVQKSDMLNHKTMRKYAIILYDEINRITDKQKINKSIHINNYKEFKKNITQNKESELNKFKQILNSQQEITDFYDIPITNIIGKYNHQITILNKFKYFGLRYYHQLPQVYILHTQNENIIIGIYEVK